MTTTSISTQALAEAAFLEGVQRIGSKYKTEVKINYETFVFDFICEDKDQIVQLAMELDDLYKTAQKRFYGGA